MPPKRTDKIAAIIRGIIGRFTVEVPPDVARIVTVTRVDVSRDMSYADIYLTAVDGVDRAVVFFDRRAKDIRVALARELRTLHRQPILRFKRDERSEELTALDRILGGLVS
jgi:ribosome-binding factor A